MSSLGTQLSTTFNKVSTELSAKNG